MAYIQNFLKEKGALIKEEYHLCCYDPAMWLEKGTVSAVVRAIKGSEDLVEFWQEKPVGNGPWSWPLKMLTPGQVELLKKRYWKTKKVQAYQIEITDINVLLTDKLNVLNYQKGGKKLFVYSPSDKEFVLSYQIDDFKTVNEFYETIEEYFGRYILLDIEKNSVFVSSTVGPFGSYTLAHNNLGRRGCRNYACMVKSPVFPLDEHIKKLTYRIELITTGLTSEVTEIIIYDMEGLVLAKLNDEGEFEIV